MTFACKTSSQNCVLSEFTSDKINDVRTLANAWFVKFYPKLTKRRLQNCKNSCSKWLNSLFIHSTHQITTPAPLKADISREAHSNNGILMHETSHDDVPSHCDGSLCCATPFCVRTNFVKTSRKIKSEKQESSRTNEIPAQKTPRLRVQLLNCSNLKCQAFLWKEILFITQLRWIMRRMKTLCLDKKSSGGCRFLLPNHHHGFEYQVKEN